MKERIGKFVLDTIVDNTISCITSIPSPFIGLGRLYLDIRMEDDEKDLFYKKIESDCKYDTNTSNSSEIELKRTLGELRGNL